MILAKSSSNAVPPACEPFIRSLQQNAPLELVGLPRRQDLVWKGERLFVHLDWTGDGIGTVAFVRLQLFLNERQVWIGSLEVHHAFRERHIGTCIVRCIEGAAGVQGVQSIRLFSRLKSTGFWLRLGYRQEEDPRYLQKPIGDREPGCDRPWTVLDRVRRMEGTVC